MFKIIKKKDKIKREEIKKIEKNKRTKKNNKKGEKMKDEDNEIKKTTNKVNKKSNNDNKNNNRTTKKSSKKAKEGSTKLLKKITPDKYFLVHDGTIIKSVLELVDVLEFMDDATFYYHVNNTRNDFYNWIKDVFEEPEIAARLLSTTDKRTMQVILLREIVRELNSK